MEQYIIEGGTPLNGEVTISGAKNAALGIIAGAIMTDEDVLIENIPNVNDINVMLEAISEIGAEVDRIDAHTVRINGGSIKTLDVKDEYMRRIRASYYFIGALLGRYHNACVPLPGGCEIGARPIDQHIKGFRAMGAKIDISGGSLYAKAESLNGAHIYFDMVTVGATINVMAAYVENPAGGGDFGVDPDRVIPDDAAAGGAGPAAKTAHAGGNVKGGQVDDLQPGPGRQGGQGTVGKYKLHGSLLLHTE